MKEIIEIIGIAGCLGVGIYFLEILGNILERMGYMDLSKLGGRKP